MGGMTDALCTLKRVLQKMETVLKQNYRGDTFIPSRGRIPFLICCFRKRTIMALLNFLILVFLIIVYFRTITEHESGSEVSHIDPIFTYFSTAVGHKVRLTCGVPLHVYTRQVELLCLSGCCW